MGDVLYFDIETRTDERALELLPKPSEPTAEEKPRNYKKPEVIEGWIEKERARRLEGYEAQIRNACLDPDYARVVAIGYVYDAGGSGALIGEDEKKLLSDFWELTRAYPRTGIRRICGFNVLGFDLPVLLRRSCLLRVQMPRISLARYRTDSVIDLMQLLSDWGKRPYHSLKRACKLFGVDDPMPTEDGSQVAEMDDETLRKYAAAGAQMARGLAQKMRGWYW